MEPGDPSDLAAQEAAARDYQPQLEVSYCRPSTGTGRQTPCGIKLPLVLSSPSSIAFARCRSAPPSPDLNRCRLLLGAMAESRGLNMR